MNKMRMQKLLQESFKLDRAGIRLGWCNEQKRDVPILKMEFNPKELSTILVLLEEFSPDTALEKRTRECWNLLSRCIEECDQQKGNIDE